MKGQAGESYKGLVDPFLPLKRAQELCESRGGRPGLPVPNSPYSLCRQSTLNEPKDGTWVERGYEGSSRGKL